MHDRPASLAENRSVRDGNDILCRILRDGMGVELRTNVPGLVLRTLSETDVDSYAGLVRSNEDHLTRYGDYRDLYPVARSSVLEELRSGNDFAFGVWSAPSS